MISFKGRLDGLNTRGVFVSTKSGQLSQPFRQVFLSSSAGGRCCQNQKMTLTPDQKTAQSRTNHELKLLNLGEELSRGKGKAEHSKQQF